MRLTRTLLSIALLAVTALLGRPALAQEAPAAAPAIQPTPTAEPQPAAFKGIEEIIVTAERREQAVQDVGVSISAFSAEDLEGQNIQDIHDLQLRVPSLVATGGLPQITLRGIGNDVVGPGVDPGFALHTNGIYATQLAVALLDFFDLDRVEVLPGPQGTLGGRNTTGGGIYLYTKRPTDQYETEGDVEVGSFGKVRTRAIFNAPLGETLAVRWVGAFESASKPYEADGFQQNLGSNALGAGGSTRLSLRWTPSESLSVDLIGSYSRDGSQGGAVRILGDYPAFPAGQSPLFGGSPDYTAATPNPSSARHLNQNRRQAQKYEVAWGQLIAEADLGPVVFKSNSQFSFWDYSIDRDQDSSDVDAERLVLLDTHKAFTQEFTLESDGDGRLHWLIGGNYQRDRAPDTRVPVWNFQQQAAAGNFIILDAAKLQSFDISPADICVGGSCFFSPLPANYTSVDLDSDTTTKVAGAFANVWLEVTDWLQIIGGVRYSYTHRNFDDASRFDAFAEPLDVLTRGVFNIIRGFYGGAFGPMNINNTAILLPLRGNRVLQGVDLNGDFDFSGPGEIPPQTAIPDTNRTWESVTGNFRVEFRPTDDSLIYASFAAGERPGGFNFVEGYAGAPGFDAETILAYEVGAKTTIADQLLFNVAAFYYDYDNKFITQVINNVANTENGKKAEVLGVEAQALWAPTEALRLNGSIGWLSAEYASDFFSEDNSLGLDNPTGFDPLAPAGDRHGSGLGGLPRPSQNLKGNPLNRSPEWTVSVGAAYTIDLGENGLLTPRLDFSWRDEVFHRQYKNPLDRQGAYTKTDLMLHWEQRLGSGMWAEAFVANLEDHRKIKTNLESTTTHRQWWLAAPRTFGVRIGYKWTGDSLPF